MPPSGQRRPTPSMWRAMSDGMVRRWTFPNEWAWLPQLLLITFFFLPKDAVAWHAVQVASQFVALVGMLAIAASGVPSVARPWVTAVLGVIAVLMLYFGSSSVYYHWQGDQVRQHSVN